MGSHEESPELRHRRTWMVGFLCLAPLIALSGRPALGLTSLCISSIVGLYLLSRVPGSPPVVSSDVERPLKLLLSVTGVVLGCIACFLFAIPHFPGGVRPGSYESAAIATLKNIAQAEEQFRAEARLDRDWDGVGEFGYLAELAEGDAARPPLLSPAFRKIQPLADGRGVIRRSGYLFMLFLPGHDGSGVPESSPATMLPDADEAEVLWCCYAWPAALHNTGKRAFFVDQGGVVWWTRNRRQMYSGASKVPAFDAAFAREPRAEPADPADAKCRDGGVWQVLR